MTNGYATDDGNATVPLPVRLAVSVAAGIGDGMTGRNPNPPNYPSGDDDNRILVSAGMSAAAVASGMTNGRNDDVVPAAADWVAGRYELPTDPPGRNRSSRRTDDDVPNPEPYRRDAEWFRTGNNPPDDDGTDGKQNPVRTLTDIRTDDGGFRIRNDDDVGREYAGSGGSRIYAERTEPVR